VACNIIKNGTTYAGTSTRGNWSIGLVVTFSMSPATPGIKPEHRIPIDTATTKSTIPRIFHIMYRRLAANNGLRTRLSTIHGAVIPIAMSPRSPCPIANLLDIVGDKWSLLVARDLFRGRTTYSQLLDSPEQISTNILADRLKRLEKAGIITRSPYQQRPVRYAYQLTKKRSRFQRSALGDCSMGETTSARDAHV
jgi:DNA-binding HxlR family transcriptional regulator